MTSVKKIKVALLALVAALVIAIPTSAFAGSLTVKTVQSDAETFAHNYAVYQLFTGTVENDSLKNIQWGSAFNGSDGKLDKSVVANLVKDLRDNGPETVKSQLAGIKDEDAADTTAAALATAIAGGDPQTIFSNTGKTRDQGVDAIATILEKYITTTFDAEMKKQSDKDSETGKTIYQSTKDIPQGYYFIKDANTDTAESQDAYTKYILTLIGAEGVTIEAKSDVPKVDKTVQEDSLAGENGSQEDPKDYGKAADYAIGQTIKYRIVGTLPANYGDYKEYYYKFTDSFSKGLTINEDSVKVYVRDAESPNTGGIEPVAGLFKISVTSPDGDTNGTLTVESTNPEGNDTAGYLKRDSGITAGKVIVVEYTAELNKNAVLGYAGNPNNVELNFSNNPNKEAGGIPTTGKTPKSYAIVFTFELDNTKIDGGADTRTALTGAEFSLMSETTGLYYKLDNDGNISWVGEKQTFAVSAEEATKGTLNFKGLDADEVYILTEEKAPAGYNKINPIRIVIDADTTYTPTTEFSGVGSTVLTSVVLQKSEPGGSTVSSETLKEGQSADQAESGKVAQDIANVSGTPLPSTGGIGTTIFYIAGIALIIAAAITLVVRRRNATTA